MKLLKLFAALASMCPFAWARASDVLFSQPPSASGVLLTSAYWDPDGSDYDEYVWDGFTLAQAGDVTEIRWRGAGGAINEFEISIYPSIPVGTQPDVTAQPLMHRFTGNSAGQTYAGTSGGTPMYDYHFTLPKVWHGTAGVPYWIQIVAWQPGWPVWGLATGTGGNGTHFHRSLAVTGDFHFYFASGDAAVTLLGTLSNCSNPVVTSNPQPFAGCAGSTTAIFSTGVSGTGPFTYRWRQNGYPVNDGPNGGGHGGGATISGATTPTLTIQNASYWADVGTYDCVITNACGPTYTSGADLTIAFGGPTNVTGPGSTEACAGDGFSLTTTASNGPLTYQWKRNNAAISDGATPWGSVVFGSRDATLVVTNVQDQDQGSYTCVVTNPCSSVVTPAAAVSVGHGPGITGQPSPVSACPSAPAVFGVTASGASGVQWQVESPAGSGLFVDLIGPVFGEPSTGLSFDVVGAATASLLVSNYHLGTHPGTVRFVARVRNACGAVQSNAADLTVCAADFDCSGFVDIEDFSVFVAAFEAGTDDADFDGTGFVDTEDFDAFVRAFEIGC